MRRQLIKPLLPVTLALIFASITPQSGVHAAKLAIEDDEHSWDALFKSFETVKPGMLKPGGIGHFELDDMINGFPRRLWDTQRFQSVVVVPGTSGGPPFLWSQMWSVFANRYEQVNRKSSVDATAHELWVNYLAFVSELYCCPAAKFKHSKDTDCFGCSDVNRKIRCCQDGQFGVSCSNETGVNFIKRWTHSSLLNLKIRFYAWLCLVHYPKMMDNPEPPVRWSRSFAADCPSPCKRSPCYRVSNVADPSECRKLPGTYGVYKNEYTCACQKGHRYDVYSGECLPLKGCATRPCNPEGTEACEDVGRRGFVCRCRRGFMGATCGAKRNACLQRERPEDTSGNVACLVADGNQCLPVLGQDAFRCNCRHPHTRMTDLTSLKQRFSVGSLPTDNCAGVTDACLTIRCRKDAGLCVQTGDKSSAVCVCRKSANGQPLYEGEFCQVAISQWLPWSAWSPCWPRCGESCYQSRGRLCRHSTGRRFCYGTDEQQRPCQSGCRPCPNLTASQAVGVYFVESEARVSLVVFVMFGCQLLTVACLQRGLSLLMPGVF